MTILDKISTIKAISNLIVLRSKYDKVCDELAYRDLEVNRLKDSINVLIDDKSYIVATLDDRFKRIETLKEFIENKDDIVEDLESRNDDLISSNAMFASENDILKVNLTKQKYFRYLWLLAGFALGVFTWAMIINYLFV